MSKLFWLAGIAMVGAYWPMRTLLVEEQARHTITTSTLTAWFVGVMFFVGWGLWKIVFDGKGIGRRIERWNVWAKGAVYGVTLIGLYEYLQLWGYQGRI